MHPFQFCPSYKAIAQLPIRERVALMRNPEVRARIIKEEPEATSMPFAAMLRSFDHMFPLGDPPNYEPSSDAMITIQAAKRGVTPEALAYDFLLERDGQAALVLPVANFADGTLDATLTMMQHPQSVLGLGDGGAHLGALCDASLPTYMLAYWARDRARGERLPLPWVVKALTSSTAAAVGLRDRGLVKVGYKADLNVIDFNELALGPPEIHHDLPGGGRRLTQRADGYVATVVNGVVISREGSPTGDLPGRLIRGAQNAPSAVTR
jgi:N-acyl-D-amino-acid deacylase